MSVSSIAVLVSVVTALLLGISTSKARKAFVAGKKHRLLRRLQIEYKILGIVFRLSETIPAKLSPLVEQYLLMKDNPRLAEASSELRAEIEAKETVMLQEAWSQIRVLTDEATELGIAINIVELTSAVPSIQRALLSHIA